MQIQQYPRPRDDNGRGIHWFPTLSATPAVLDTYIAECQAMHIKWVHFLNGLEAANLYGNDYLVGELIQNDIMPVMRVFTQPTAALPPDRVQALVAHYVAKGVSYFQLFNEPNQRGEWSPGDWPNPNNVPLPPVPPDLLSKFVGWWCDAALQVIDAGGLPGFPGLATAGGYYGLGQGEDLKFFIDALDDINARLDGNQRARLYDKLWISLHNYNLWGRDPVTTPVNRQDSHCFRKFAVYDEVIREKTGRSLPILGTEGGTRLGISPNNPYTDTRDENVVADHTVRSFQYMMDPAPDYFFCFSPWIIASRLGGNLDPYFEETAWYRANGTRQRVVDAVKAMPSHARTFSWDLPAPPVVTFQADTPAIIQGQSTILRWTTLNVTAVAIDGVPVDLSGQRQVQPVATTTYALRAVPRQGAPLDKTVTVTVIAAPEPAPPPLTDVSAELPQYPRGGAPVGKYPQRTLDKIAMLVIHHTNEEGTTPQVLAERLVDKRHWPGIGYHFMVAADGTIYQTNHLETVSYHTYDGPDPYIATRNWDLQSVGVAFVGKFDTPGRTPNALQLESGGKLCAWLLRKLNLAEDAIRPRCDLMTNPSPNPSPGCTKVGSTWVWKWKDVLLAEIRKNLPPVVPYYHYLLFWKHPDGSWAKEDWDGAQDYIKRFQPTCGFSVDEAWRYVHVSIVGGPFGVPESDEQVLRAAGCRVERLAGEGFAGTAALLKRMAAEGHRFLQP